MIYFIKGSSTINIKKWDPKTPYITALKKANDKYATYLEQRSHYINSPAFYFDCAAFFITATINFRRKSSLKYCRTEP